MLTLRPISLREARAFVQAIHRHHKKPQGGKFAVSAWLNGKLVGVAIVGRPTAREEDDGLTAEVTRLATDGTRNACSFLYARAKRAAQAMGYVHVRTRILDEEPGTSLKAAGWEQTGRSDGGSWSRPSRPREDKHPTGPKKVYDAPAVKGAA